MSIPGLDPLVDRLLQERDRLARERAAFLAARVANCAVGGVLVCLLDPLQFQTQADSVLSLIESLEEHVGVTLPRLEERFAAGDAAAGQRALDSSRRIIEAVGGVSPVDDAVNNAAKLVRDIKRDAAFALGGGVVLAIAVLAVIVLMKK